MLFYVLYVLCLSVGYVCVLCVYCVCVYVCIVLCCVLCYVLCYVLCMVVLCMVVFGLCVVRCVSCVGKTVVQAASRFVFMCVCVVLVLCNLGSLAFSSRTRTCVTVLPL
jgi:hypothetical protein